MIPYLFLELQPPRKTVIIIKAKIAMTKTKSPSNATRAVLAAIGMTKRAVRGNVRYIIGVNVKMNLSHSAGIMSSFERSLMKSAIGCSMPAGPAVDGP